MAKEVVLVTGSSGCLGQHVVKLLQEKDDAVKEIRLYDIKPYSNELGHAENKPVKEYVADILDMNRLEEAMEGVDCVIHTAAYIDLSLQPDNAKMEEVNVRGTENVVAACIKCSVPRLIFTSTVDVVIAGEHIFYGMENTTPVPRKWLLGQAAGSKYRAESCVLQASGRALANGDKLRTVSMRPTLFYGECDTYFVPKMFEWARKHNGTFQRVHSLDERLQLTYVGNVAWAHLTAKNKMANDESISGEAFYVTDETPIQDVYINTKPYFEAAEGVRLSESVYPYWIIWIILNIALLMLRFIRPFCPDLTLPSLPVVDYLCSTFFFNRTKAILRLDYTPLYSPEEAQERSLEYYKKK